MGMAFSHALELIPKMRYDASLYLTLQRTLYPLFGAPMGAAIEVGAVAGSVILAFLARRRRNAFALTMTAAICMLAAHAIWWLWVNPANVAMFGMTIRNPPQDWRTWRDQWEYAHLARFALEFISFTVLLLSVIRETPLRQDLNA
jgi:hypothetical protein